MSLKTATLLAAIAAGAGLLMQVILSYDVQTFEKLHKLFDLLWLLISAANVNFFITLYRKQNGK